MQDVGSRTMRAQGAHFRLVWQEWRRRRLGSPVVAGAAVLAAIASAAGTTAYADPVYTLVLQDSGGTSTQTDNGTGLITYTGTLGGFSISSMAVQDLNTGNPYDVAFGSQDIFKASGSDVLHVFVTVSNLTSALPGSMTIGTTSSANFQGSKIMAWSTQTYFDPGNHTGTAGLVDLLSTSSGGPLKNSFSSSTDGTTAIAANPFSYTVEFTLNLLTNEFANAAGATTDVTLPEPGSGPAVLGGGLGLLLLMRRRKQGLLF